MYAPDSCWGVAHLNAANSRKLTEHFVAALEPPQNLSEAKHLLANQSDIHYWIGESFHRRGDNETRVHGGFARHNGKATSSRCPSATSPT